MGASRGHVQRKILTWLPLLTRGMGTFASSTLALGVFPSEKIGVRKIQNLVWFNLKSMRKIKITNMIEFSWK